MLNRSVPFLIPLFAFATVISLILIIGNLLLYVAEALGEIYAAFTALGLIIIIGLIAMVLDRRASRLAPAEWPQPGPTEPVRKIDLGAGYVVGQFIAFFIIGLLLLVAVLALKR